MSVIACPHCGKNVSIERIECPSCGQSIDMLRELLLQRRKIEAIKVYRERHGAGLKEAKEAVEQNERQLQQQGVLPASAGGRSCLLVGLVLWVVVMAVLATLYYHL